MIFKELLNDKGIKPKEKTALLSQWLLENPSQINELIAFAVTAKDPVKATCIEAIEYATKSQPNIAPLSTLKFVSKTLTEKAPRIKWESAKVVGNIAHLHPGELDETVINLLANADHQGTVVRWATAFALGQIIKIETARSNNDLVAAIKSICDREEKSSIKKVYQEALRGL